MLYDPTRDVKSIPTIAELIMWLEQKPPNEEYCWAAPSRCLLAEYLSRPAPTEIPTHLVTIILPDDDLPTYGAALARARAELNR